MQTYARMNYKQVIEKINTPEKTAWYLKNYLHYKDEKTYRSFKYIHERTYGLCAEYAFTAAALLYDNGYPPLILHILFESKDDIQKTHTLYIFQDKKTKKWGTLGQPSENFPNAIFNNPTEICAYFNTHNYYSERIVAYQIHNLTEYNFIDGDKEDIYDQWNKKGQEVMLSAKQN